VDTVTVWSPRADDDATAWAWPEAFVTASADVKVPAPVVVHVSAAPATGFPAWSRTVARNVCGVPGWFHASSGDSVTANGVACVHVSVMVSAQTPAGAPAGSLAARSQSSVSPGSLPARSSAIVPVTDELPG
jgi:hypothetical protein